MISTVAQRRDDLRLAFGGVPFFLARRLHIARNDGVDADIVAAKVARQAARQTFDRRLGGLVERQFRQGQVPADRSEIQDHAAARALHRRHRRLGREEEVTQIDRHAIIPISGRHVLNAMAVVIGGIVDEDVDAAQLLFDGGDHRLHRIDVAQVDRM